ncbi:uncharacterized protein A4U43_C09F15850 [Asparagus officinalis]|uniref:Uncharacterized protein n=1 Tax=Asparagus officinalis TaxID=4686 RepID=A0A5P1E813_ASPOF|nr:uncharacterized protein A4U43_C09F15850 [Asparagus officinalis]
MSLMLLLMNVKNPRRMLKGLVCSSTCNTETMVNEAFHCYYLLQPSERGAMFLRRLAGAEEVLPNPDMGCLKGLVISEEIKDSIHASLSTVNLRDYNPLQHERGFHPKMNWLVKESLQLGSIPQRTDTSPESKNTTITHQQDSIQNKDDNTSSCISEEWEQLLIVDEMNDNDYSLASIPKSKIQDLTLTQSRNLDDKTCRILERLEAPKQLKEKVPSPSIGVTAQLKKPLLPLDTSSSQPMKPHFQKLRKRR